MDELHPTPSTPPLTSPEFAPDVAPPLRCLALISAAAEKVAQDASPEDDDGEEEVEEGEDGLEAKDGEGKEEQEGAEGSGSGSDAEMAAAALEDHQLDDPPEEAADAGTSSPHSIEEQFVEVDLADIRRDVQCPICLGIIRKTRTVMECLHRFCRECIDKSMRLGNNECPVCRTHCASRRSLRDDLNFDALIAALYTDVDKYEEEEFALREENERRNKQLQQSIAETLERQSDAVTRRYTAAKTTDAATIRRAQSKFRNIDNQAKGRTQGYGGADDESYAEEYEQTIGSETTTRERRSRRRKRETAFQLEATDDEQGDVQVGRSARRANEESKAETSSGTIGKLEGLATWARAGSRSSARSGGNLNVGNNRLIARATMLLDALSTASQMEKEVKFDVHLTLQPFDHDDRLPDLEKPYLCCPENVTVQHVCKFLANRLSIDPEDELELVLGHSDAQDLWVEGKKQRAGHDPGDNCRAPEILQPEFTLGQIHDNFWFCHGNLVLMYRRRG